MALTFSSELVNALTPGTGSAGLSGAPSLARSTSERGILRIVRGTFVIPASGAGSASGDQIVVALLDPFAEVYDVRLITGAMGAAVTLAIGVLDPNNSANNNNAFFLPATPVTNPTDIRGGLNIGNQVGADALGDQSTGNVAPPFGSGRIGIVVTIAGTPTAAAQFTVILKFSDGV